MPVARALFKVQKNVAKKRGGKSNTLHKNSRDLKRLQAAALREEKLASHLSARDKAHGGYLDRIKWYQELVQTRSAPMVDTQDLSNSACLYSSRFDSEYILLRNSRRPGRPPSTREEKLKNIKDEEEKELRAGLWIPDLRTMDNIERLKSWDGEWNSLDALKFIRFTRENGGKVMESSFPPNGLS